MLILKQLRRKKSISQSDLANAIGVSLRTIQLYEKENANIPIKNLTKIAEYFGMGIDRLYAQEVNEAGGEYGMGGTDLTKAHSIQKLGPGKYLIKAPLILGETQLAHSRKRRDIEYLRTLPSVGFFVEQVSVASYLAFEIVNSAMDNGQVNRIPQKSMVLGKLTSEKQFLKQLKENGVYWILVCKSTIMCKEIAHYDKMKKSILCHSLSDSPEYPDFEVLLTDILAFYRIVKRQLD